MEFFEEAPATPPFELLHADEEDQSSSMRMPGVLSQLMSITVTDLMLIMNDHAWSCVALRNGVAKNSSPAMLH